MHTNINLYLDTVQHLTFSYADCKESCYEKDSELKQVATEHGFNFVLAHNENEWAMMLLEKE